jgi:alpha-1,6-mannosyltransferase
VNLVRVPLGVDLDLFSPHRRSVSMRDRFAAEHEVLLVHCGRLSVEKKPERSIDALAALRLSGVPAVLVVAGDGPLRKRLAKRAAGLPVFFTGFLHDRMALAALLATAEVVLAPGPVETFGLAALEALACGTPVVVSASSALPEVVGDAGIAIDGEDFADGVAEILARPVVERRAAARRRAEEFGWPAAVRGFLAAHSLTANGAELAPGGVQNPAVTQDTVAELPGIEPGPVAAGSLGPGAVGPGPVGIEPVVLT